MWEWDERDNVDFSELKGKTIAEIEGLKEGSEEVFFTCTDGSKYRMIYHHDCCAGCSIEELIGCDVQDLIGHEVLMAEEVSSQEPDEAKIAERKAKYDQETDKEYWYGPSPDNGWKDESETWTFYKLATIKGSMTIRWYGSSNGYYSESPSFEKSKL